MISRASQMSRQEEALLIDRMTRAVRGAFPGAYVVKLAERYTRGLPDLLIIARGVVLFVEAKTAQGRLSPIQEAEHAKIRQAGGNVLVARSPDVVIAHLRCLADIHAAQTAALEEEKE